MRKLIAIFIMIFITVGFYLSLKREETDQTSKNELTQVLEEMQEQIDAKYPSDPTEIITMHNTLMEKLYSQELVQEEMEQVVQLQRALYEESFLELNPQEYQLEKVNQERLMNEETNLKMIGSKIISSYEEPQGTINIEVTHYTNQADVHRNYFLEKEFNEKSQIEQWKISGWKNIKASDIQEE